MTNILYEKQGDNVFILVKTGKTMISDGVLVPAEPWATLIPISDTEKLSDYLTQEEIDNLQN